MENILKVGLAICVVFWAISANAQKSDPHLIYEQICADCNAPHAEGFALEELIAIDDDLVGKKSGRLALDSLKTGHGRISDQEVNTLIEHLENILKSGRLFRNKCIICHDNAARFARLNLLIRDGVLTGRYTGRNVAEFLSHHGRLDALKIQTMVEVPSRQLLVQ